MDSELNSCLARAYTTIVQVFILQSFTAVFIHLIFRRIKVKDFKKWKFQHPSPQLQNTLHREYVDNQSLYSKGEGCEGKIQDYAVMRARTREGESASLHEPTPRGCISSDPSGRVSTSEVVLPTSELKNFRSEVDSTYSEGASFSENSSAFFQSPRIHR